MKLNLSPEAINRIREKFGKAEATTSEIESQMASASPVKETIPSPGSSAWYRMKKANPEKLAQMEKQRNEARAVSKASTPKAGPEAGQRPAGVSQYVWDRVASGTLAGLNTTSITRDPEVREALIKAGHEDYVKAAYEKSMDQRAAHYGQNGADDPWATAQESWYNQQYGQYKNTTVESSEPKLGLGGSTGDPTNEGYVPPEAPPPVVEEPPPANGGNPGGMFGGITDAVNDNRPPEEVPPPGGAITGPTYQEQLEAAQAAQKAAYEQQLAAQQAQYDQQVAAQQAAYEQRQADAEAARQAEIDRRNAEALAKKEANTASWASANASAAGIASSAPSYTKKYGEGATAGVGLLSGVNSVRGDPARTGIPAGVASEPPRTGGARPSGPVTGGVRGGPSAPTFKPPVIADDSGFAPSHQPGGFNPSHDVWDISHRPKQESTPWADAFLRSKKAAEAPGAVSGMMKKWME